MSQEIMTVLPEGSCPTCGHRQFIVKEIQSNLYLTSNFGEIIASKEEGYACVGKCLVCGKEYSMYSGPHKFIPLTPMRKILYDYSKEYLDAQEPKEAYMTNPMFKE